MFSQKVILRDGSLLPRAVVVNAMDSLKALRRSNETAFFVLVDLCHSTAHTDAPSMSLLKKAGFIDTAGKVNDRIKTVLLNALDPDPNAIHFQTGEPPRLRTPIDIRATRTRDADGPIGRSIWLCQCVAFVVLGIYVTSFISRMESQAER